MSPQGTTPPRSSTLQSPYKSPIPTIRRFPDFSPRFLKEDEFDSSPVVPPTFSPFVPSSATQPLRTPVKQYHRTTTRSALAIKNINSRPPATLVIPAQLGTKRKSTSTPVRSHPPTPLTIHTPTTHSKGMAVDFSPPIAAPRFLPSPAEINRHLRTQTDTMTQLTLADLNNESSDNEFDPSVDDSGIGEEEDSTGSSSFHRVLGQRRPKVLLEVAETISPGGHITKRRVRSRPVSLELLEPSVPDIFKAKSGSRSTQPSVLFPSRYGARKSSSSPETLSPVPRPRRRASGVTRASPMVTHKVTHSQSQRLPSRATFSRLPSAASLFFNPAPEKHEDLSPIRPRTVSSTFSRTSSPIFGRPTLSTRHSYAGSSGSRSNSPLPFSFTQCRSPSPSPRSSPLTSAQRGYSNDDEDEEMFFMSNVSNTSFHFNLTEGTPLQDTSSPRISKKPSMLKKKYNPRDSGITLSDDDDLGILPGSSESTDYLSTMPGASTSVGSIFSDNDDPLVTPGVGPHSGSGWPDAIIVDHHSDVGDQSMDSIFGLDQQGLMEDAFIRRTLAAGPRAPTEDAKKIPGTPVKKLKASHLGITRPWQSAVQGNKVGGVGFDTKMKKTKGKPRASLPAAFAPVLGKGKQKVQDLISDSEEDTEDSPSGRKEKYTGVGLGRPSAPAKQAKSIMTRRGLTRRSSSGTFSSSSETSTPTRIKAKDWNLPPTVYTAFSPSGGALRFSSGRSASGSSNSSSAATNSPTINRTPSSIVAPVSPRASLAAHSHPADKEGQERLENDFVEVESVGSGHFGRVFRARLKNGTDNEVFAIKRSEQFEPGGKKRLRLREEVEILDHLRSSAIADKWPQGRHPNVLAYIDSWEQDRSLYIRTELCDSGNFETFLGTYGHKFPALDEARVWKIIADLSNGLQFIHDAGVIHLDIKPANIFMTSQGHFKIGDFGMASLWPVPTQNGSNQVGLEREGDKRYLAPEILQNTYGPAADIFSFGMTMLETAANIEVPADGPSWHRLREDDFRQVPFQPGTSPELIVLLRDMMRRDISKRTTIFDINKHPVVFRARQWMQRTYAAALAAGASTFPASALAGAPEDFLEEILARRSIEDDDEMDVDVGL